MHIAAYEYIAPAGRFAISLRPYGRWRVRCPTGLIDRSFASAQEALDDLLGRAASVPAELSRWTPLDGHTGETVAGELAP